MAVREVLAGIAVREREGATDWRPALRHALARAAADARACELAGDHRAGAVLAALELLRAGLDAPGDPDATVHMMRAADHGRDAFSALGRDLTEPELKALTLSRARVRDRWAALRDGLLYPGESSDATLQRALDAAVAELAFLTTEAP